ncbi:MAG: hypothetical protein HY744_03110 [Deltaproteobacteria bacterium]|nr:hypothetical protein [Deltaproteobacteria bacterium]
MMLLRELWRRLHLLVFLAAGLALFGTNALCGWLAKKVAYSVMPTPTLLRDSQNAVLDAAQGDLGVAKHIAGLAERWPSDCSFDPAANAVAFGSEDCIKALNARTPYAAAAQEAVNRLVKLGITGARLASTRVAYSEHGQDVPWSLLPGGGDLQKLVSPRAFVPEPDDATASPLGPATLLAVAGRGLDLSAKQADVALAVQNELKADGHGAFGRIFVLGAGALVLFVVLGLAWEGFRATAGRSRWLWLLLAALAIVYATSPAAFDALALPGGGDAKRTSLGILDAPALVLSQLLGFAGRAVTGLLDPAALQRILLFALLGLVFFWRSLLALPIAAYGLLVVPLWLQGSGPPLVFSPFDPGALLASPALAAIAWLDQSVVVLLGVFVAVGMWAAVGAPALARIRGRFLGVAPPPDEATAPPYQEP